MRIRGIRLRVKALEDTVSPDALTQAVERAETAKGDAVKAQGEASKSAEQASTSASNANTSATNAKTSEDNAKSYATQAKNATALKVDQRINTADESEYPLVVMVDKDTYKFIAPKGATNTSLCRYCCDGTAHYFGLYGAPSKLFEYDDSLNFIKALNVDFGQKFYGDSYVLSFDFCTKIGDCYYIRHCSYPYSVEKVIKYGADGTKLAEVSHSYDGIYARVCRNERTNHLIIFKKMTDNDGNAYMGYEVYDEDLVLLGTHALDCDVPSDYFSWLQHLNVVGSTTFISYAPTDPTKNAIHILDAEDKIVRLSFVNPSNKAFVVNGSGDFTSAEKTSTKRTDGKYFTPRMFYDGRDSSKRRHRVWVFNGAKTADFYLYTTEERMNEVETLWERYLTTDNLPSAYYDAGSFFFANGSGDNVGAAVYVQNVANLSKDGIVVKILNVYNFLKYTAFAPDPFSNLNNTSRALTGNCRLAYGDKSTMRNFQLYPAGTYGQAGGAIMFTV